MAAVVSVDINARAFKLVPHLFDLTVINLRYNDTSTSKDVEVVIAKAMCQLRKVFHS
jgi:hypothetical protein